jgi:hypothetical protein
MRIFVPNRRDAVPERIGEAMALDPGEEDGANDRDPEGAAVLLRGAELTTGSTPDITRHAASTTLARGMTSATSRPQRPRDQT